MDFWWFLRLRIFCYFITIIAVVIRNNYTLSINYRVERMPIRKKNIQHFKCSCCEHTSKCLQYIIYGLVCKYSKYHDDILDKRFGRCSQRVWQEVNNRVCRVSGFVQLYRKYTISHCSIQRCLFPTRKVQLSGTVFCCQPWRNYWTNSRTALTWYAMAYMWCRSNAEHFCEQNICISTE